MKMCTNNNYMQVRSARWIPTQIYLCSLFLSVFCVGSTRATNCVRLAFVMRIDPSLVHPRVTNQFVVFAY